MAAGAGPRPSEAAAPSATSGVCLSVRLDALFSRPVCLHSLSEHLACTRQHWPECWPPGARRRVCLGQAAVWGVCVSSSQWVLWWKTGPCPAHAEACPLPGDSEMGREAPVAVRGRRAAGERLCGSLAPGSRGDLEWGGGAEDIRPRALQGRQELAFPRHSVSIGRGQLWGWREGPFSGLCRTPPLPERPRWGWGCSRAVVFSGGGEGRSQEDPPRAQAAPCTSAFPGARTATPPGVGLVSVSPRRALL